MAKTKKEIKQDNIDRECEHVWESWDYHIEEKWAALDRIIRLAITEMTLAGKKTDDAITFIQPRFEAMRERVRLQNEKELVR